MKIGVIKETKDRENRVALTPHGAKQLICEGHEVCIEKDAGVGSGFTNEAYKSVGTRIVNTETAWDSELVIKIKEPLKAEYQYLSDNILFAYLHLAGVDPHLTRSLLKAGTTAIAYETVEDGERRYPLLAPMSAVAGNMSTSIGGYYLARPQGGKGVQPCSIFGKRHGKVMIIGDGIVGLHAAKRADGLGANVLLLGRQRKKFDSYKGEFTEHVHYVVSNDRSISKHIKDTDLLIGAVLLAGARTPHVVSEEQIKTMEKGSVVVDVSIDQGGCIETSRPTSHSDPVFIKHGVTHYCVTNMPGAFPRTATIALTDVTLPYIQRLAHHGHDVLKGEKGFARGVNTYQGKITLKSAAKSLDMMDQYQAFQI
ncbi:MAG: alanine dehydrogenase [Gammaproteobacteria bacterium]|nr:alanine dehydrogenase [Gammaproteobacteria bacterium]NIQ11900.1 alanine dehydrogenase [Gammaproteobacteria bacterium]NIQ74472.1 alanine dehydrogenase [Gammaproteobacteria bacterium]NIR26471.1 alanine dehydrogenase [Gammaproteobacteria bacterium]NIR95640.1 alanine dehydrogenase [Gammaproteobacteria bacterium]